MLKFCMLDYKIHGVKEIDHGTYTVNSTKCVEAKLNGVVARVNLKTMDYDDFLANKSKYLPKKRGRKRKADIIKEAAKTPQVDHTPISNKKHFNGESVSGKRQRKPNSKFSDYIIPSNYIINDDTETDDHIYQPNSNLSNKPYNKALKLNNVTKHASPGRPRLPKPRVKERILSSTDDEIKLDTGVTVDPLDLHPTDDVVHSFLPMFEPPPVLNYTDDYTETDTSVVNNSNEKNIHGSVENETGNEKSLPVNAVATQPLSILSPNWKGTLSNSPQIYGKLICMPLILQTNSENAVKNIKDSSNETLTVSSKADKPRGQTATKQKNDVAAKNVTPKGRIKHKTNTSFVAKAEPKSKAAKMLSSSRYILVDCDMKYKPPKVSDIDFNKLVHSLKSVTLPAKNWKIRIIVSPQETITEVIFTNKEEVERCVKFSRASMLGYKITFGKSEVKLLGAPTLQTFDDIAALLEIIHTIPSDSHVLEYC